MTIDEEEALVNDAQQTVNGLRANFVRGESDFLSNKINGKIQEAEQAKVHTMLVIGGRDPAVTGPATSRCKAKGRSHC